VLAVSLLASSAVAASSTNATSYTAALFARIPLPPAATRIATPSVALHPVTGSPAFSHVTRLTRYYVLPASLSVGAFAKSHFAANEYQGTGSTYDGGERTSYSFSGFALCANRHAAYCSVTYTTMALKNARQELRVDVDVVWTKIHTVHLPTTGVVTVTGFQKLSLMNASSGPVVVTLNASQVRRLSAAISKLRTSPGGVCMEDSTIYKISLTSTNGAKVTWSAVADECPGVLRITTKGAQLALNDRSCALESLVSTFFSARAVPGTKAALKVCTPLS